MEDLRICLFLEVTVEDEKHPNQKQRARQYDVCYDVKLCPKDNDVKQSKKDIGDTPKDFPFPGKEIDDNENIGGDEVHEESADLL
jgi:hypothetical protein